jgi:leader peptidase (prepilin peptidase)/N-methyltransferase
LLLLKQLRVCRKLSVIFLFLCSGRWSAVFLNVVIHRVPNEESIVFPNSACPKCKKSIKPYDNIPILSWLILRGKCRNCRNPIAPRYPAVELLTALLFMLTYRQIGFSAFLPVCLVFTAAIVALIFIDAEHMILPNVITYPLLAFALLVRGDFSLFFGESFFSRFQIFPLIQFQNYPAWLVSLIARFLGGLIGGGSSVAGRPRFGKRCGALTRWDWAMSK